MTPLQLISILIGLATLGGLAYRAGASRERITSSNTRLRTEFRAMRDVIGHIFDRLDRIERHLQMPCVT